MSKTTCDFLVIGTGIAGLSFAIRAARFGTVVVITKKRDSESNTNHAQGGIACVLDPHDTPESHIQDTLATGCGLCNEEAVELLVREGPQRVKELLEWGVPFSTDPSSNAFRHLELGREGGHTFNRIVHARDLTGKEIETSLLEQARRHRNITLHENHYAIDLITDHHLPRRSKRTTCYGAYVLDTTRRRIFAIASRITFLATGGAGQVYLHTTNPPIATGDGLAAAYRAGAEIANMEFIQFHPTTLYHPGADSFLISEALRGYGAVLRDRAGNEFMDRYHPMKSLAPRDVVARAVDNEIKHSGQPCVYLDVRHAPASKTRRRFPNIYARCRGFGIDITRDLIPVVPAAHYLCGGIRVDTNGRTSIANLYACGEVACTGVHGANRLASNSLLEAVVFSRRAAHDAGARVRGIRRILRNEIPAWDDSGTIDTEEWVLLSHNFREARSVMWDYVGIVRSDVRLERARRRLRLLEKETEDYYRRTKITPELLELRNIVTTATLIVVCAIRRHESRGLHYTTDYPAPNDRRWKKDSILKNPLRTE
ncbi:MAG: L-aspartate oxidase [Chitinivibrionales bacterium]|nr:L-aspartate oxidase [Chitinivibrionales bacterium]MBD3395126.1 L-aspartate oxidase [Chitinivibrionales bacterium]